MRNLGWLLVVGVLLAGPAMGQEGDAPTAEAMDRHERALQLRAREAELEFQQRRREIELRGMEARIDAEQEQARGRRHHKDDGGGVVVLAWLLVVHILLTVWVCKDMREKGIGRALWVPIVLLAGICGALLYALVRLADTRAQASEE